MDEIKWKTIQTFFIDYTLSLSLASCDDPVLCVSYCLFPSSLKEKSRFLSSWSWTISGVYTMLWSSEGNKPNHSILFTLQTSNADENL